VPHISSHRAPRSCFPTVHTWCLDCKVCRMGC